MEKMLQKLAHQLDSLDESSLTALWGKYARLTGQFEPTKRWEEACLIFSLIQAKRWKNQLFNYSWSRQRAPGLKNPSALKDLKIDIDFGVGKKEDSKENPNTCRVINFKSRTDDK